MTNLYSTSNPWNIVSEGYEKTTMFFTQAYAQSAIDKAELNKTDHILDLACGPGTVSRLIHNNVSTISAVDFSEKMIHCLEEFINKESIHNVTAHVEDGQNLSFESNHFDRAFSIFGLMFFPDRIKGFSEVFRTLKPNGKAFITSWKPVSDSPAMQLMFKALQAANPELKEPESLIKTLEFPDVFQEEMEHVGFKHVCIESVTHDIEISSITKFWEDMTLGSAPIAVLKSQVHPDEWKTMEERALSFLNETLTQLPIQLSASAWLGSGVK